MTGGSLILMHCARFRAAFEQCIGDPGFFMKTANGKFRRNFTWVNNRLLHISTSFMSRNIFGTVHQEYKSIEKFVVYPTVRKLPASGAVPRVSLHCLQLDTRDKTTALYRTVWKLYHFFLLINLCIGIQKEIWLAEKFSHTHDKLTNHIFRP